MALRWFHLIHCASIDLIRWIPGGHYPSSPIDDCILMPSHPNHCADTSSLPLISRFSSGRYMNGQQQQLWPLWPVRVELEKLLRKKVDMRWLKPIPVKTGSLLKMQTGANKCFWRKKKKLNPSWTFSLPRQCIAELLSGSNCQGVQLLMAARWCSLRAGADLVQIYTGFVYEGPKLIKAINKKILQNI